MDASARGRDEEAEQLVDRDLLGDVRQIFVQTDLPGGRIECTPKTLDGLGVLPHERASSPARLERRAAKDGAPEIGLRPAEQGSRLGAEPGERAGGVGAHGSKSDGGPQRVSEHGVDQPAGEELDGGLGVVRPGSFERCGLKA